MRNTKIIFLAAVILWLTGCRFENDRFWDVDLIAPIAQGELTMKDLIEDSTIREGADQSLDIVNVIPVHEIGIGELVQIPDTVIPNKKVTLKTLSIGQRTMQRNITLGEIAKNAGIIGAVIIGSNGDSMVVPAISNMSSGDIALNATSFFKTATFISGTLRVEMTNGLPIEVTNLVFELKNKSDQSVIVRDTIPSLLPAGYHSEDYPLAGKTVEGEMLAKIVSLSSPGSNGKKVLIDTSDALEVRISAFDMQVEKAEAIFPAQNLLNDTVNDVYNMNGPEITYMIVRSGKIGITVDHTIQENLHLRYYIPGALKSGQPLDINTFLPASTTGENVHLSDSFPIDGYGIDFTGKNKNTVNTFYRELVIRIDSTGQLKKLSLNDSIEMTYGLHNIVPEYFRGYLGQKTMEVYESADMDILQNLVSGGIRLEDLTVDLEISNGVGAPATMILNHVKAINSKTGKVKQLNMTVPQPITLHPAQDMPFQPAITTIRLDGTNSNIKELLELIPDRLEFAMQVFVNPAGNTGEYKDFIYYDSKVKANLNIELPLQVGLLGLTLQDTTTVDMGGLTQLENVQDGKLNLTVENSFPVDAAFQIYLLDRDNHIIDSLLPGNAVIEAGIAHAPAYRVTQPTTSTIQIKADRPTLELLKNTENKLILRTKLDTKPLEGNLKIYSDYRIRAKLTADLRYRTSF